MTTRFWARYMRWEPERRQVFDLADQTLADSRPVVHAVWEAVVLRGVSEHLLADVIPHTGKSHTEQIDVVRMYLWRGKHAMQELCGGSWIEVDDETGDEAS